MNCTNDFLAICEHNINKLKQQQSLNCKYAPQDDSSGLELLHWSDQPGTPFSEKNRPRSPCCMRISSITEKEEKRVMQRRREVTMSLVFVTADIKCASVTQQDVQGSSVSRRVQYDNNHHDGTHHSSPRVAQAFDFRTPSY